MNLFKSKYSYPDLGLLLLRVFLGVSMMVHGYPKITGGPEFWEKLGGATGLFGLDFAPTFWGFMGAFSEFYGGLLFALGLFFRPVCALLFFTMIVALGSHIGKGDGFNGYSHALEVGSVFLGLFLVGPGKYSLNARLNKLPFLK